MSRTTKAEVLRKQQIAVKMVGSGSSFDQVAEKLGYTNRGAAWRLVQKALRAVVVQGVEEYRELELSRLDALQACYWASASQGDLNAARVVLRVIEQRSRLLGLNDGHDRNATHVPRLLVSSMGNHTGNRQVSA